VALAVRLGRIAASAIAIDSSAIVTSRCACRIAGWVR
jgi:hypothetical protein